MRRSRCLCAVLGAAMVSASAVQAGDMRVLYPLYSYPDWYSPSTYLWPDVAAAAGTVPVTAIINPSDGPGGAPNDDYVHGMNDLRAGGVTMIGYVYTGYGTRDLAAVEQDVDTYAQQFVPYGLAGIFVDEASNLTGTLGYYAALCAYIKAKPGLSVVITNPGTNIPEAFVSQPTSDTTVIFEDTATAWPTYPEDSYVPNHPSRSFAAIIHGATTAAQMEAAIDLAAQRNVGYVFVTDASSSSPNPYASLPGYWTAEVHYIATRKVHLNTWRQLYFPGSTATTGPGADTATPHHDGLCNLLKFATGMDPAKPGAMPVSLTQSAGGFVFTYSRSKAAVSDGLVFTVEWSDDLTGDTWNSTGVVETAVDQGATERVRATVPAGSNAGRFVHLKVISP